MTSRALIFGLDGSQIAELNADFRRTWKLNEFGTATFTVSTYDVKTVLQYLEFGRYIYIDHPKLGAWAGVIDPPREWGYHQVTITAYGGEYLLKFMRTPLNWKGDGAPGPLFADLITKSEGPHAILSTGSIYAGSKPVKREAHLQGVYDLATQWAKEAKNDWEIVGSVASGRIQFTANYYDKKGETRLIRLDENLNVELSGKPMREQGTIFNDVWGYDSTEKSWDSCMKSHRVDKDSAGRYGDRYTSFSHTVGHIQSASDRATDSALDKQKQPRKTFDLTALDVGDLYNNLRTGDTLPVHLVSVGFQGGSYGVDTTARLLGMTYADLDNKDHLVLDEAL